MTAQAAALELELPGATGRPRSARPFFGAARLSSTMLVAGLLTYAFQFLAARTLTPTSYGQIAVLWATLFIATVVLFRPLEQTTSRALAERLAVGDGVRGVLRTALLAYLAVGAVGLVLLAAGWGAISSRLFLGDETMTLILAAGFLSYGLSYLARGAFGGASWFGAYGTGLLADAALRFALAVPLVFLASQNLAAAAVAVGGLAGAVVPGYLNRRRGRALLGRAEGPPFRLGSAFRFAAPAGLIAGADQLLVNGAPLLVMLEGGEDASRAAGVVFAATMLVRVPVYLFQGLAVSLLPNLTRLHAVDQVGDVRRAVVRAAIVLLATGALIVVGAAAVGPDAMSLLFGEDVATHRLDLVFLGAGVGCYLVAATISQALLALDDGARAAVAWIASTALFVAVFAFSSGSALGRISVSFMIAAAVGLLLLGAALAGRLRSR